MSKAKDQERINQLKLRIWGYVARNLLNGKEDPYEISENDIESHRGRIKKALIDIKEYIRFSRETSPQYAARVSYYKVLRFEESKTLGSELYFANNIQSIHKLVFGYSSSNNQYEFNTIGYRSINDLHLNNIIYVYWNQNEFDIVTNGGPALIYPKALLELRIKLILRSIIEQHIFTFYHSWIEKFLGLPEKSMKTDDEMTVNVRNFAAYSFRLSKEAFMGINGFRDEYLHFANYFQALAKSLDRFDQVINKQGGYEKTIEIYRKEVIKNLLDFAPVHAFSTKKGMNGFSESIENQLNNPFLNTFILKNASYLDYDTLYDKDQSLLVINKQKDSDKLFKPNQNECNLIKEFQCSQNLN